MLSLVIDGRIQVLLEMDNGFSTKQWKHGGRRSSITRNKIVLWKNVIWNDFVTKLQIKSKSNHTFSKSNHYSSNQIIMSDSIMI